MSVLPGVTPVPAVPSGLQPEMGSVTELVGRLSASQHISALLHVVSPAGRLQLILTVGSGL